MAAANPCIDLSTPDITRLFVKHVMALLRQNSAAPVVKIRFLPDASAAMPAASRKLPNVSINPFVSHASSAGVPPSIRCIAGVVTTPPVKLNGSSMADKKMVRAAAVLGSR
ncbi:hypothetical protein D3C78_1022740 [compost metagenome]